ncbi:ornithine cyclodeaminase family protein [Desulfobacca acetoxidans]|uniref:Putative alanine dehydrogenase n=1 Tax=Desulfobacca acetoxidans (strain ATCC 700848 / DSM 11109 / ASRB2) TaxID=880072 RepID=F2NEM8_DESAR|nr:ornithine cyclodeaminase family protein [Desulfobacca acetoxidans]AEB08218.1 Ornithine cyclodeaminase [Desulfobacca acetoxidans DSM 11109]HAY22544.1 ornithine cyclodeaminase family protein [Desulfobacterales bacterium]
MSLILTGADILQVLDIDLALQTAAQAFLAYGEGRVNMPPKVYLRVRKGDFRAMYGAITLNDEEVCGLKWVNVHPDNPQRGLPTVMAKIVLNDPESALELADMDGTYITNYRTGAAGGLAAKYLSRPESSSLALIGAGVQARMQIAAVMKVRPIRQVAIYNRTPARAQVLMEDLASRFDVQVMVAENPQEAVQDKDIVVTATASTTPLVRREWISPGTHINAIGADAAGKQELDPAILTEAKIFVDDLTQAQHSGEINLALMQGLIRPEQIAAALGQVVAGKKPGRENSQEITVFDSTGLIIQDLALGRAVLQRAKERGLGEYKEFIPGLPPK